MDSTNQIQRFFIIQNNTMSLFQGICEQIISPPKIRYSPYDLGVIINPYGKRIDFNCMNAKGFKLQASFYKHNKPLYDDLCVLYLHSMNGSRLQSTVYVETIMKMGLPFCSFDFTGCGNSQGNSISFGANQKHDVVAVIEVLKETYKMKRFIIWGRSMGAASAVKYCEYINESRPKDFRKEIVGIILDSCFKSFSTLAIQIGKRHSDVPEFLIKIGYFFIRNSLEERGSFRAEQLQLEQIIQKIELPFLFLASDQDTTVSAQHSKCLFDRCQHHKKRMFYFKGVHNQARDNEYVEQVKGFIKQVISYHKDSVKFRSLEPLKFSKSFRVKDSKHNLVTESLAWEDQPQTCYCSFFSSTGRSNDIEIVDPVPTTRRKFSEPQLQKVRIAKRQLHYRSSSNLPLSNNFK